MVRLRLAISDRDQSLDSNDDLERLVERRGMSGIVELVPACMREPVEIGLLRGV